MAQTITVQVPDNILQRYQKGADAARKLLEDFIAERLEEAIPAIEETEESVLQRELDELGNLDNEALWKVAHSKLPNVQQLIYDELLVKNSQGTITQEEQDQLSSLGEEARRLTLKKSHAYMLLKWRGCKIPSIDELMEASE